MKYRIEKALAMIALAKVDGWDHPQLARYAYGLELEGIFLTGDEHRFLNGRHDALDKKVNKYITWRGETFLSIGDNKWHIQKPNRID